MYWRSPEFGDSWYNIKAIKTDELVPRRTDYLVPSGGRCRVPCPQPAKREDVTHYRGTSRIRNCAPPQDRHKALGIVLLKGPMGGQLFMSEEPLNSEVDSLVSRHTRVNLMPKADVSGPARCQLKLAFPPPEMVLQSIQEFCNRRLIQTI